MTFAHIGAFLEPLLFAPALLAVGWAIFSSRRQSKENLND